MVANGQDNSGVRFPNADDVYHTLVLNTHGLPQSESCERRYQMIDETRPLRSLRTFIVTSEYTQHRVFETRDFDTVALTTTRSLPAFFILLGVVHDIYGVASHTESDFLGVVRLE